MKEKSVSLKAIASRLGVSINTVSHALRDLDDISEALKIRIRRTAIEMGYMPNHVAQKMKKDERPVVGVFADDFSNLYFNSLYAELLKAFRGSEEFDCVLMFSKSRAFDVEMIKKCILQRVDVIITYIICDTAIAEFARLNNVRIVYAGSAFTSDVEAYGMDIVDIDNNCGCRLAADYFAERGTGDKLAFVGSDYTFSRARYNSFKEETKKLNPEAQVDFYNISTDDVSVLYDKLRRGCRGIFCFNDMTVYELLRKLSDVDKNVFRTFPDLDILGFDGLCERIDGFMQISTIMIDFRLFAEKVYETVKLRIENPTAPPIRVKLPVTLHRKRE